MQWSGRDWAELAKEKRTVEGKVYVGVHNNICLSRRKSGYEGIIGVNGKRPGHVEYKQFEAFNHCVNRFEYESQQAYDQVCVEAASGVMFAEQGSADVPSLLERHAPILWDERRILRDHKHPTPGPVEARKPNRHQMQVVHRYLYDGQQLAQRETYRNHRSVAELSPGTSYATYDGKYWPTDYSQPEVTRFIPAVPGNAGATFYCDGDGTMDVATTDHFGQPWFRYRAREGRRQFATADHQKGRNSGLLKPISLPTWKLTGFQPWYMTAIEPDVLMGRRGVLGWDGKDYSEGLLLNGPVVNPPEWGFWERAGLMWERDPLQTTGYVGMGVGAVAAGTALTIVTAGAGAPLSGFIIGGAVAGFGMGFGVTGVATHDFDASLQAGSIGAAAGAVAGAAGYGVGLGANAGLQWLVTSGRSLAQLGISTVTGAAAGVAAGGTGGFVRGTLSGLAGGQSWADAASLGWGAAKTGALWGGIIGGATGFLSGAVREFRYMRLKQSLTTGLGATEAQGMKFTMTGLEDKGFRVQGSLEYNGSRHGIDLWARGLGRRSGTLAVAEAKASGSLGSLGRTTYGRQAGPMWVRTSAEAAADAGLRGGQEVLDAFRAGGLDMYIGLAGSERFGMVNTAVWLDSMRTMNFRQFPNAVIWL